MYLKTLIGIASAIIIGAESVTFDDCGHLGTFNKILDGEYTAIDEFPWIVRLGFKSLVDSEIRYHCGGALISKRTVLTAGHCLAYMRSQYQFLFQAVLGEYDTSTEKDCVEMLGYTDCADPLQVIPIHSYVIHPEYLDGYRDIALVFLQHDAKLSEFVQPICLPPVNASIKANDRFIISGWGRTETGQYSTVKLKATIPVQNFTDCAEKYSNKQVYLNEDYHMCAGIPGRDSCTGDSGLPLMSFKGGYQGRWTAFGITSRGNGCGKLDWPGIYTKVPAFVDWIRKEMKLFDKSNF